MEHYIMQACIMEHEIVKAFIYYATLNCESLYYATRNARVETTCYLAREVYGKMADQRIDQITPLICHSIVSLIHQLEACNGDSDSLDSITYRVDWLYGIVVRYSTVFPGLFSEQAVELVCAAKEALLTALGGAENHSFHVEQLATGACGRPKFNITKEQLQFLLERGFSVPDIAQTLGVSVSTIERRLREFRIPARSFYSVIDDETLDRTIRDISRSFPSAGYRRMTGFLLSRGIKVQQERIRESMWRVDPEGVLIRSLELSTVNRRRYQVYAPLALWHIDGNHKLIRYVE
jgi:transcriptional regulator with XRE-family HTH domain